MRIRIYAIAVMLWIAASDSGAADERTIGVISDGQPIGQVLEMERAFQNEIRALTAGEFDIRFKPFIADWTTESIVAAFEDAEADPDVDLILALGLVANQLGVGRERFAKPTFLPLVRDSSLLNAPVEGDRSGKSNLNYLSNQLQFDLKLESLRSVARFDSFYLMTDELVTQAAPVLVARTSELARQVGVETRFALHDGQHHRIDADLPEDTEAVIIAFLPRMPPADFDALIERLTQRGIPTFGLSGGRASVERGMLASDAVTTDLTRLQRRAALNVQSVLLGGRAEDQPIGFEAKRELNVNMEVARRLGISPRFDVLSQAVLINEEPTASGPRISLTQVAQLAVERNLDLVAERLAVGVGAQSLAIAGAGLLPSLSMGVSYLARDVSPLVELGQASERSTDGSLSLSQPIYVDDLWANQRIQQHLQTSREQVLEQARLDIIQEALQAFLNMLRAETQLRIFQDNLNLSRANLELARGRVRVGSSSSADVYRWEARLASARTEVLSGRATLDSAREALNRVLHQPLNTRFQAEPPALDALFSLTEAEFMGLVNNPRRWRLFIDYEVGQSLERAPELGQFDALIAAKQREVVNRQRDFWLPDLVLSGRYTDNLDQSGVGAGPPFGGRSDWSVMLQANLPIFEGGARRSELARTRLELEQLQAQRAAVAERIEQAARANFNSAYARYNSIRLSAEAAEASRKNLELVTDAYSKGLVSVLDLLDAQNASLQADESAENAVVDFLLIVVATQRVTGLFPFMLPEQEQQAISAALRQHLASRDRDPQRGKP